MKTKFEKGKKPLKQEEIGKHVTVAPHKEAWVKEKKARKSDY